MNNSIPEEDLELLTKDEQVDYEDVLMQLVVDEAENLGLAVSYHKMHISAFKTIIAERKKVAELLDVLEAVLAVQNEIEPDREKQPRVFDRVEATIAKARGQ